MKTIRKFLLILLVAVFSWILSTCGSGESEAKPTPSADAIRTEAVATYVSSLTETLSAALTQSPTDAPSPTFTLPPLTTITETAQPVNTCYDLIWLGDVTIPDNTLMKAGEAFTKTWRVQNNGGCAWAPGFTFSHVGGEAMRGKTLVLTEPIPVGAIRELSIQMAVPTGQTGLIQGTWRMADGQGNYFGDTLSVNIIVGNETTPTASPSAP